jgi:hypothetical protein
MNEAIEPIVEAPSPPSEPERKAGAAHDERTRGRRPHRPHPLLAAMRASRLHLIDLARVYGYGRLTAGALDLPVSSPEPESSPKPEPQAHSREGGSGVAPQ